MTYVSLSIVSTQTSYVLKRTSYTVESAVFRANSLCLFFKATSVNIATIAVHLAINSDAFVSDSIQMIDDALSVMRN
mgnify:FL=1